MSRSWAVASGMILGAAIFTAGGICGFLAAGGPGHRAFAGSNSALEVGAPVLAAKADGNVLFPDSRGLQFEVPLRLRGPQRHPMIVPQASFVPLPLVESPNSD